MGTSTAAAAYVVVPVMLILAGQGVTRRIYFPYLISTVDDGLAEPVSVHFGRRTCTARALFTTRRYTRTLEGNACVFVVGVMTVCLFAASLTLTEIWAALLTTLPLQFPL